CAICSRMIYEEVGEKKVFIDYSVATESSQVIPFRDNGFLVYSAIVEPLNENSFLLKYIVNVVTVPWYHGNDSSVAMDRHLMLMARMIQAVIDLKSIHVEDIPPSIALERNGYEAVLPYRTLAGTLVYDTVPLRVSLVMRSKSESTYVVHGSFTRDDTSAFTREELLGIVFGERCKIVESLEDGSIVVHKEGYKTISSDHLKVSSWMYAPVCALFHFSSIHSPTCRFAHSLESENNRVFFFRRAFVFFSSEGKGISVQYSYDIVVKEIGTEDMKETMKVLVEMSVRMEKAPLKRGRGYVPKNHSLVFNIQHQKFDDNSFFPQLPVQTLKKIGSLLPPQDVAALKATNKHIRRLLTTALCSKESSSSEERLMASLKRLEVGGIGHCMTTRTIGEGDVVKMCENNEGSTEWKIVSERHIAQHGSEDVTAPDGVKADVYVGHTNIIRCVDVDSTGLIVTGSSDRKIRVWSSSEDSEVFIGPNSSLVTTKFVDGAIAVAYKCGTVKYIDRLSPKKSLIFDVPEGKLEGFYPLRNTEFLVWNERVDVMEYIDLRRVVKYTYNGHVRKVTVTRPLGEEIYISGSADRTVHIWDTRQTDPIAKFRPHKSGITLLETFDDFHFATVANEKTVSFWDTRNISKAYTTLQQKTNAIDTRDKLIVCGLEGGVVSIVDVNGKTRAQLNCGNQVEVSAVAFNKGVVAVGSKKGKLYVFKGVSY
ncbi:F-box and WD domain protein, putative, partial [Entamoeba invadens IP1]